MTLFLHGDKWKVATRTSVGFKHTTVGNVVNFPTRDRAVARAHELGFTEVM